jgi:hypothetical protein
MPLCSQITSGWHSGFAPIKENPLTELVLGEIGRDVSFRIEINEITVDPISGCANAPQAFFIFANE